MSELENEDLELNEDLEPESEQSEDEAADDEDPAAEPDTTDVGPQPEPPQDEDRSKMFAKIDRSFGTYRSAVERNLEDEVTDWFGCPLCFSSAVPGYVNKHDMGRVPEDVQDNVRTFFGLARETDYASAPGIVACTDCGGLGKVSTGSRVAEHATITCPTCKGYGYTPPPVPTQNQRMAATNGQNETAEAIADLEVPDRDNWGEPRVLPDGTLNDNYGKMPQFKSVHPVYGVTASLSPEELITG